MSDKINKYPPFFCPKTENSPRCSRVSPPPKVCFFSVKNVNSLSLILKFGSLVVGLFISMFSRVPMSNFIGFWSKVSTLGLV